jgi:hypothetical protein
MSTTRIDVADGKYSILHENGLNLRALRHGEPWNRDLVGDNLVYAMAARIEELQEQQAAMAAQLEQLRGPVADALGEAFAAYGIAIGAGDQSRINQAAASFRQALKQQRAKPAA